jgi:ribosomal protein S30
MYVRAPFNLMVQNGWRRQNLIGRHHFSEDTGELTRAGELKVDWVTNQAPPERRQIFVTRSHDRKLTRQRLDKVRSYAATVASGGLPPLVSDTHLISEGRPAVTVDSINSAFKDSMPIPTLPAASSGGEQ